MPMGEFAPGEVLVVYDDVWMMGGLTGYDDDFAFYSPVRCCLACDDWGE
jgi:hypothetical protein